MSPALHSNRLSPQATRVWVCMSRHPSTAPACDKVLCCISTGLCCRLPSRSTMCLWATCCATTGMGSSCRPATKHVSAVCLSLRLLLAPIIASCPIAVKHVCAMLFCKPNQYPQCGGFAMLSTVTLHWQSQSRLTRYPSYASRFPHRRHLLIHSLSLLLLCRDCCILLPGVLLAALLLCDTRGPAHHPHTVDGADLHDRFHLRGPGCWTPE